MEDNRIISQELEEMRSQISLLKDKLEKQAIVNAEHIIHTKNKGAKSFTNFISYLFFNL